MAAKSSLGFLLLTGNLAGQWLCFKWKSVGFDSLRGALPSVVVTGGPMREQTVLGDACKWVGPGSSYVYRPQRSDAYPSFFLLLRGPC